jgi:hypothetical protein
VAQSSSWEASSFSASQIPHNLWNQQDHYHDRKISPLCPHPEPDESIHTVPSHFFNINIDIHLPFTSGSPKLSFSIKFPHQNYICISSLPKYMSCNICPTHFIVPDLINLIIQLLYLLRNKEFICSVCVILGYMNCKSCSSDPDIHVLSVSPCLPYKS